MFHATMSSYDGAEVCELVRLFILDSLAKKSRKGKVGIFGYDRLALLKNTTARAGDESRKKRNKRLRTFRSKSRCPNQPENYQYPSYNPKPY